MYTLTRYASIVLAIFAILANGNSQCDIRINEIHYDQNGGDADYIEVRIADPQPVDLSLYFIQPYNGSNTPNAAPTYSPTFQLSGATVTSSGGYSYYVMNGTLQNGAADGIALVGPCGPGGATTVIEFLSYEGQITASNGAAAGLTSVDIGVVEGEMTPTTHSLQLINGIWSEPTTQTKGTANAFTATTCILDSIVFVSNGECSGFNSTYSADVLIYSTNTPASGMLSVNGKVFPISASPQLVTLTNLPADGQPADVLAGFTADPNCFMFADDLFLAPASCLNCEDLRIRINEFHYDDPGDTDTAEFVEIRSEYPIAIDPALINLYFYNGGDSMVYRVVNLANFTVTNADGFYYYTFDLNNNQFQNGPRDGLALVSPCGIEFISYEGTLRALDGPASGLTSEDIGVSENPVDLNSLQIIGDGWEGPIPNTKGLANEPFTDCNDSLDLFILNPILCVDSILEVRYIFESRENEYSVQFNPFPQLNAELVSGDTMILRVVPTIPGLLEIEFYGVIHGCQTPSSHYIVMVEDIIEPNAGPDLDVCVGGMVAMQATGEGFWSGGMGSFSNANDPNAIYSPADSEEGTSVELVWTQMNTCGSFSDTALVTVTAADEVYQMNCIAQVNLSLGPDCIPLLTYDAVLSSWPEGETFGVVIYDNNNQVISQTEAIDRALIGQTFKYVAFGPFPCNNNSCWGEVQIEDKLGPTLSLPDEAEINCLSSTSPEALGYATGSDCGEVTVSYHDSYEDFECGVESNLLRIIYRKWTATDDAGNSISDTQYIYIYNIGLKSITRPNPLVELACGSEITPEAIADELGVEYGFPYYLDQRIAKAIPLTSKSICKYAATYTDAKPINACGEGCNSSYKLLRTWIVLDWCLGITENYQQIIKLVDETAPTIMVSDPDKPYTTNAWSCDVDIVLPSPVVTDNCDEHAGIVKIDGPIGSEILYRDGKWIAYGVPKGVSEFVYNASDCCGNLTTATIEVEVEDKVGPVAIVKEFITVSLTSSSDSVIPGVAKVTVDMINNDSYDNCSDVYLEIRRDANMPTCLNEGDLWNHDSNTSTPEIPWNNNRTYNGNINGLGQNNLIHPNDRGDDTDGGQFVTFCCEDVTSRRVDIDGDGRNDPGYHKVWLRVWDDADMDGIFGSRGDNYNETWAIVKVEDKTTPRIVCEKDITTYCDRADVVLSVGKWTDVAGNVPAEYWPWIDGVCTDLELEFMDSGTITTCNTTREEAPLTRTYRIKGTDITCTSKVYILDRETDPKLDWPIALHTWTKCELTVEDVLDNTVKSTGGKNIKVASVGELDDFAIPLVIEYVPYYWYEWMQTGANTPNLGQYCLSSSNNDIDTIGTNGITPVDGGLSVELQGKARFNPNWRDIGCRVFGRKIIIDEYEVGEGCKKWLVRFEYIDWCNPQWAACISTVYKYEDQTPPGIEVTMSDTISVSADCNTSYTVNPRGEDGGGCDVGFKWEVTISLGTYAQTQRATGNNPKITFTGLEAGKYNIHYKLTDGCGNVSEKDGMLLVLGKDPTPYCINLSSAVMKNGVVELWARDFDQGSYANCLQGNTLYFTFDNAHPVWSKIDKYHFFMGDGIEVTGSDTTTLYQAGIAQKWLPGSNSSGKLFGCTVGDGSSFPASEFKMTVWDINGLSDYCEVSLSLVDNQGICGEGSSVSVGGKIATEFGAPLVNATVEIRGNMIGYPKQSKTNQEGRFAFNNVPMGITYEVAAKNDVDYRNGVNTLDLVLMQRHILALKKLDSPYKLIASDADNDQQISVEDLVQLRKLILGIENDLINNQSWRFVDKDQQMGDQPWPFKEIMSHQKLMENAMNDDFVAVKIGDVNGSARTSLTGTKTDTRSKGLEFVFEDKALTKGENIELAISSEDFEEVYGFQLGLQTKGLEIMDVEGRGIDITKDQYAGINKNSLRLSWSSHQAQSIRPESTIMILRLKAEQSGQLSDMISIDNSFLHSEAYTGSDITATDISISAVRAKNLSPILYQNTPNPWRGETTIGFDLPESGSVQFTVSDITGKIIMNRTLQGMKGANRITLNKSEMGLSSGVLMYKIEYGGQTFVKKMILVD